MPRSALPQDYILNNGTQIEDFETIGDWTVTQGSIESDAANFITGTKSVKCTTAANGYGSFRKPLDNVDLSKASIFRLWIYLNSAPSSVWYAGLRFSSNYFTGKSISARLETYRANIPGGIYLEFHKDDFTSNGGETFDNLMTGLQIEIGAQPGGPMIASFDDLRYNHDAVPRLVISFDDSYINDIGGGETAYSYMQDRGISGTIYVISDTIGNAGINTVSQLQSYYAAGWAISNHTEHHLDLTSLTRNEVEAEIKNCTDWLILNNMPRAAHHIAYPGGYYNDTVIETLRSQNMLTGRTSVEYFQTTPVGEYFGLYTRIASDTITLASVIGWIEQAIKYKTSLHLCLHRIVSSPGSFIDWSIADFKALIDYIVARRIPCVTIDEWYEGLTNPRYRSLPFSRSVV